jgi:hypothetical protein
MRRYRAVSLRVLSLLVAAVVALGDLLGGAPPGVAAQAERCFAETNQCIRGRFLDYWQANGGLARNGFPLTGERRELLEDGDEYVVQYFERVRLELHSENAPPYDMLLGQFGRRVARTGNGYIAAPADTAPATPAAGRVYFSETGHNLGGTFLSYWEQNGGLTQFGFPLTEEFAQRLEDGREYTVQYFERARFERHQENAPPFDVLLGQFGRRILSENTLLAGDPTFARFYFASEQAQRSLGSPRQQIERPPAAYQRFERGAMLYRGDYRLIYVLCGDERAGRWLGVPFYTDKWFQGDPIGGGPGPAPGLYEPRFGFGELWRENREVRDCLGYATTPDETSYTARQQEYGRGMLFSAITPEGRFFYMLYVDCPTVPCGEPRGRYERYPDPSP